MVLTKTEKPKVRNALTRFARKYCATFDSGEGLCSLGGTCKLMLGKKCGYFKGSVFSICNPGYKFATETKLFPKLFELYSKLDHSLRIKDAVIKMCPDCGSVELKPRRKYCQECSEKRKRATERKSREKARSVRNS